MNGQLTTKINDCDDSLMIIKNWIYKNPLDNKVRFLTNYSVLMACSCFESCFKEMYREKVLKNASAESRKFIETKLNKNSANPKLSTIICWLSWIGISENFKTMNSSDKLNIDSLVTNRNAIAHGTTISTSIDNVIAYFASAKNALLLIDNLF